MTITKTESEILLMDTRDTIASYGIANVLTAIAEACNEKLAQQPEYAMVANSCNAMAAAWRKECE